jgi:hypothetical protein
VYPGYTWLDLGDGIYLHSQSDPLSGPVDGNSVVVIGDAGVMVIDTHIIQQLPARSLRRFAR